MSTAYPRLVQHCDDTSADRLEAEGWTIERGALAQTHHGFYRPHLAWRPIETSGTGVPDTMDPAPPIPLVPPEDLARAHACRARESSCPTPSYCPPACRRWA